MQGQLERFGIEPIWISGGDRGEMRGFPPNYSPEKAQRDILRQMGLGEIGCLMGHLRAFQEIIDSGDEWGIILEDDVDVFMNPVEALSGFEGKLVLGNSFRPRRQIRKTLRSGVHELAAIPYGAFCYAIHRRFAAQAIVHLAQSLHMPSDVYFRHACRLDPHGFFQVEGVAAENQDLGFVSVIGDEARMHNFPPTAWRKLEVDDSCPKLIHQIWLGPKPVPAGVEAWQRLNPGRIHKLWTAGEIWSILADYGMQEIWTSYMSAEMYPAAADVARYCILHRFGGFYADADSEPTRWMDIVAPFFVFESERYRPGLLCNGFLQLKAEHPVMEECISRIAQMSHPVPAHRVWQDLGPQLLTDVARPFPQIHRFPSSVFLPEHFEGDNDKCGIAPYCQHNWGSTHKPIKGPERTPAAKWLTP